MIETLIKLIRSLIPPLFSIIYTRLIQARKKQYKNNPDILFSGDDAMFKELLRNANVYGEYGCGKSTIWALNNTSAKVVAVDTSEYWIEVVRSANPNNNYKLNIGHADCGELGEFGRPIGFNARESFHIYTDYLWQQPDEPDVVLVDGRFRVCCFLTSLKFGREGARLVFDDYTNRPDYHVIEKYVSRVKECGRQCLFLVPPKIEIDFDELDQDIHSFRHVKD